MIFCHHHLHRCFHNSAFYWKHIICQALCSAVFSSNRSEISKGGSLLISICISTLEMRKSETHHHSPCFVTIITTTTIIILGSRIRIGTVFLRKWSGEKGIRGPQMEKIHQSRQPKGVSQTGGSSGQASGKQTQPPPTPHPPPAKILGVV